MHKTVAPARVSGIKNEKEAPVQPMLNAHEQAAASRVLGTRATSQNIGARQNQAGKELSRTQKGAAKNNPLKNAPHTQFSLLSAEWTKPYTREQAAFPLPYVKENKFWPSVGRVNNTYGDRNLVCTCEPVESYMEAHN